MEAGVVWSLSKQTNILYDELQFIHEFLIYKHVFYKITGKITC